MNKTLLTILSTVCLLSSTACAKKAKADDQQSAAASNNKVLVAYFSATGTTARVAQMIATATSGELMEIEPTERYTDADLDWTVKTSRSSVENAHPESRPAIVKSKPSLDAYDVIYLGFPNWWNGAPRIINTFIETYGLKGKKVVPFMTSGGSEIERSERLLKEAYPDVDWQKGRLLNQVSQQDVDAWVKSR